MFTKTHLKNFIPDSSKYYSKIKKQNFRSLLITVKINTGDKVTYHLFVINVNKNTYLLLQVALEQLSRELALSLFYCRRLKVKQAFTYVQTSENTKSLST